MTHCAGKFEVGIGSNMRWFTDYTEAVEAENEELYAKVKKKLEAGERVILTLDMYEQMKKAQG